MFMSNIKSTISPKSIAIIGASSHSQKVGFQILQNIQSAGFTGEVYPINPKGGEILGLKVLKSVAEIKKTVNLAIIVIPRDFVMTALAECVAADIRNVVVISAGFSEINGEGKELEDKVVKFCRQNDVTLIGPNCLGLINTEIKLNATFAKGMPEKGAVSFMSQSGAIISSMISLSDSAQVGFSKIFSLGNKALVGEVDLLKYLYDDPETKVIIGYIESLKVTPELTELLNENTKKKPTVILFGGKSALGAKAAASHTGAVVTSYVAIKTYLEQTGVILADNLEDLLLKARIFSCCKQVNGKKVAIITNAGGPAIATSDAVSASHLELAEFSDETNRKLSANMRSEASFKNPVDLLGDATAIDYKKALDIISADKNVDAIILLLTPQTSTDIVATAEVVVNFNGKKPLLASFVGGEILTTAKELIEKAAKPCFSYPEEAVTAIRALVDFSTESESVKITTAAIDVFNSGDEKPILKKFDLPVVSYYKAQNKTELVEAALKIGYPVVVKVADKTAHKTDEGGVATNIQSEADLIKAAEKIGYPVVAGKMIKGKFELLLGIKKDGNVGTTVLFGTGGIYSEIYGDFGYAIAPLTEKMATDLILSTKIGKILAGARGQKVYNLEKLSKLVCQAVTFADNYSNIKEVDFNPIIVTDDSYEMVDVRIITS
ncbi:hypothetical protein COT78_02710 [Candidatus Berkelbacteria bacterium CG10_big_fil_rev_8_21_14_0_10_43_13]|uniref:ATP-grasp domain-containing protein n=1 Tax=Candidatus Berkelbacteria bacterium CG10_big_fil_rev_8_21_14_0_10_43_13 TaxID=1974514 RepID=A0A2H0W663_9BACT|nr:MAG: hypothetical protein COT78_02710 [Candidatus Berkelbacteria bacterium CG10_big_fil_rev_8_21_14_0_10_43_13]